MRIRKRLLLSTDHAAEEERNLNKELGNQEEVKMMNEDDDEYTKRDNRFRVKAIIVEQPQSSGHHQQDRWGDNDKVIPLKKRRGNFDQIVANSHDEEESDNMSPRKRIMSKKSKKPKQKTTSKVESCSTMNSRKVIMEGSRCSRVNGRGWRCLQQTLIGYSLCEHHLGKGRVFKSVNSLSRVKDSTSEFDHETDQGKEDNYEDDHDRNVSDETVKTKKRKKKKGMVKARSISSLFAGENTG